MSFATSLKRAFGFRTEADEEEFDTSLPTYAAGDRDSDQESESASDTVANPFVRSLPAAQSDDNEAQRSTLSDPSLPGDLFDALIELFNSTMPDFVAKCLSTDAQRRYLFDSLDESLRRRLSDNVVVAPVGHDNKERERMIEEVEKLRVENKAVSALRETMEQNRLSAERQKRALTDRVIDLQNRVADLEEANEKLRLEAAQSRGHAVADMPSSADVAAMEQLKAEVTRLSEINEQLEAKNRMGDAMIADLTNKAAEARKEIEQMSGDLKVVEEISGQLEKVEQVVSRKDARIAELTEAQTLLQEKLERVVEDRESMRRTIENNLYNQAHTEARLRKEIKSLEKKLSAASAAGATGEVKSKSRSRRKISAIDESLENTDWFDSTPPPGEGKPESPDNPDFGYQAPQRKKHTDNDAQMLLW